MTTKDGKKVKVIEEPSEDEIDKRTGKVVHKPKKQKIVNEEGEIEDVEELEGEEEPSEYDERTGKKKPKKKKYINKKGDII